MRCGMLINAIGCIDGSLIDEAEIFRPQRRKKVWLWAASAAACLCVVVFIALWFHPVEYCNQELCGVVGAEASSGFLDYNERAEAGKVLITDELQGLMDRNPDTRCRKYVFSVRITDANGAGRDEISYSCLGINDDRREYFIRNGIVSLSREEILSIKCPSQMALIVYPSRVGIGKEFLNTVERQNLDIWVELILGEEFHGEYDYISEYDRLGGEERLEVIEDQISRFFEETYSLDAELDEEFKKFLEEYDNIDIGARHDLFVNEISKFFYRIYTKEMINSDLVKEYIDSFGEFALDFKFRQFLQEERVLEYVREYAADNGINLGSIKEYSPSGGFRAELDTELIKKLYQDKRTRTAYFADV